jgi:transcriptional regulator with XRE-family HTH domain
MAARVSDTFGEYLRKLRLDAGFGLRAFAEAVGMKPSNLSRLETGRLPPPTSAERIRQMAEVLGLKSGSAQFTTLNDLAAEARPGAVPPDIVEYAAKQPGVPLLLRTARGKRLSEQQFKQLARFIQEKFG